jgi:hypothetical protein
MSLRKELASRDRLATSHPSGESDTSDYPPHQKPNGAHTDVPFIALTGEDGKQFSIRAILVDDIREA